MMQRWTLVLAMLASAAAGDSAPVRVNSFPNAKALPLHAGVAQGIFARHGLSLQLSFTENSTKQREGLAAGEFDLVHSAVDNAVAMVETAKKDVVIVTGGDNGMNEFFVQADVRSFADLRGRKLVVDASNTAYAIQAEQVGMKSLGNTVDILGPYQANGAYALRAWVGSHGALLERYIAAYVESLRWVRRLENQAPCVAILMDKLKIDRDVAERTYRLLVDPVRGFTPDAAFDTEGFRNLLALRAEIEGGSAPQPEKYLDLSYYRRAIGALAR